MSNKVTFGRSVGDKALDGETSRLIMLDGEAVGSVVCVFYKVQTKRGGHGRSLRCVSVVGRIWGVEGVPASRRKTVVECRPIISGEEQMHPATAVAAVKHWARDIIADSAGE